MRDPLAKQSHDPDIAALVKVCDVQDISLVVNLYSSEIPFRDNIKSLDTKKYIQNSYIIGGNY